jgi:hypothetical protein
MEPDQVSHPLPQPRAPLPPTRLPALLPAPPVCLPPACPPLGHPTPLPQDLEPRQRNINTDTAARAVEAARAATELLARTADGEADVDELGPARRPPCTRAPSL